MKVENVEGVVFQLLGTMTVRSGEKVWRPRSLKGHALLCYLLLAPSRTVSREKFAGLLWSESVDRDARVSLRQVLSGLRKDLLDHKADVLHSDRSIIAVQSHCDVDTDLHQIERALTNGVVLDSLAGNPDRLLSFLYELDDLDPGFSQWLSVERAAWIERLSVLLQAICDNGSHALERIKAARVMQVLDATNERACRCLMKSLHTIGDTAGALRAYSSLWDVLDAEFDMEPSLETQDVVALIKLEEPDRTKTVSSEATPTPSLKIPQTLEENPVLLLIHPFSQADLHNNHAHVLRAFRHELIATLVRFKHWSIREYDSEKEVHGFEPTNKTYELVPATHFDGAEVHFVLTLRRKLDGHYLWSESHSLAVNDMHAMRRDVIRKIAQALDVQISEERLSQIARRDSLDVDIYDRWLQVNSLMLDWEPDAEKEALAILEGILEVNESFAPANASIAQVLNTRHLIIPGTFRDKQRQERALKLARRAARLAPMDNRIQLTLAWSYMMLGRFAQAETHYELALKLNDADPWTLCSAAQGLAYCGHHQSSQELATSAVNIGFGIEPVHWAYLGFVCYLAGDYERSVEAIARSGRSTSFINAVLAASHAQMGSVDQAKLAIDTFYWDVADNWHGTGEVSPELVFDWFSHLFPIRQDQDKKHLCDGVLMAGMLNIEHARLIA